MFVEEAVGAKVPSAAMAPCARLCDMVLSHLSCSYSSGGEDGYVRIHYFDPHYFEFEFEG